MRERLERYDLLGARGLALAGGAVMLLGVVFLFVLAVNRGWIGPSARVIIGALVSAALVVVGIGLQRRYGRLDAAVAAVATGIAGGYATLAAATMRYEMLPTWGALLVATAIAVAASIIAVAWEAELVGILGLLGALSAPALVALDEGLSAEGAAFALLVFAAAAIVACWMRWRWLLGLAALDVAIQVVLLAARSDPGDTGAITVASMTAAALLAAAVGWQAVLRRVSLDWLAVSLVAAATAVTATTLRLYETDLWAGGALLVAAAVGLVVSSLLTRSLRPLGEIVGVAAIVLAALGVSRWWVSDLATGETEAIAVASASVLGLLGAAIAWQLTSAASGLDRMAAVLVPATTALALTADRLLFASDRERGLALLVAAGVLVLAAVAVLRRSVDLTRVLGGAALVLLAVATADLVSGRDLAIVWSAQALALALTAYMLRNLRYELAALAYVGLALGHLLVVDLTVEVEGGGQAVLEHAAPSLFAVAVASLGVGLLQPRTRADSASTGLLGAFEPMWEALLSARIELRAALALLAWALAALATSGLADGRTLTFAWSLQAVALAVAAFLTHETRLQVFALLSLALAGGHAIAVEAPPSAILEFEGFDFLAPVPSVAAVLVASALAAATALVRGKGIAWLGPIEGLERGLVYLRRAQPGLQLSLALVAAVLGLFAAGLVLVAVDYTVGQVATTTLWSFAALAGVAVYARAERGWPLGAAWVFLAVAVVKGIGFDAQELGETGGGWSLLLLAAPVVVAGLLTRWFLTSTAAPLEIASGVTGVAGLALAWAGLDRLATSDRALGLTLVAVAGAYVALAAVPYLNWREGTDPRRPWARNLATIYWVLALDPLLVGEALVIDSRAGIVTAFAITAAALGLIARPLDESRLALAGLALIAATTLGALAGVAPPDRFVQASEHPGSGLWALVAVIAAWLVFLPIGGKAVVPPRWVAIVTGVLGLYALSLGILELAQQVSGGSVTTDFQRGHTAVSTTWGVIALALFGVGLATGRAWLRWAGLALFGVALAKLFLYDLRTLSSMTRALSFLVVGALLLVAAFFAQRVARGDEPGSHWRGPPGTPAT